MKIVSYNCNSIRNNVDIVKTLFGGNDIVLLQELMLEKRDLCFLNDFNENFKHIAFVNDREMEGICEGRPSRGVAIYWRKDLLPSVSPVLVNDYLIGIILDCEEYKVLILNVYMPCDLQTADALENYKQSLALLDVVIREQNVTKLVLMGDFNADPTKGRFWHLLKDFCFSLSLHVVHEHLSTDTFTYLCPSKDTTSWLDHVICSRNISENISSVSVDYNVALYDHFPLCVNINFPLKAVPFTDNDRIITEFVNWNKMSIDDKEHIRHYIDDQIASRNLLDSHALSCYDVNCKNDNHNNELTNLFNVLKNILIQSTDNFKFVKVNNFKVIPGWNDYVKQFYNVARECFLLWKDEGRPLQGILLENMKASRAIFRNALKFCRDNDRDIRNSKLLENLKNKNFSVFWSEVAKVDKHNIPQPTEIDGLSKDNDIANLFLNKYSAIFNRSKETKQVINISPKMKIGILIRLTDNDIRKGIKQLKDSIGFDCIHSNHLKISSGLLHGLLAQLYTRFFIHSFVFSSIVFATSFLSFIPRGAP